MLEGIASASLDVLQATALVAFIVCFLAMMVLIGLTAMAAPLSIAAKILARRHWDEAKDYVNQDRVEKPSVRPKDVFFLLVTWLALYGFYLYLTGGLV